ncbi:hypothetical protein GGR06_003559 [Bacteroides reticulotermitis]|uniref:Uncharacterized protein n=1 Tax=Bacteroides reticulotermitis TaxID=1133319 RepID=A0A840CZX8_9BACE|nr:hypothetical protein [Bacteroides reticulotermitis]
MKPVEIQSFQRVFFYTRHAGLRRFEHLDIFHPVVFPKSLKKATKIILFHLFTIICAVHFQGQEYTFAYLLECRTKGFEKL